jgi:hypothetical protein
LRAGTCGVALSCCAGLQCRKQVDLVFVLSGPQISAATRCVVLCRAVQDA